MRITTNNVPRDIIYDHELTAGERKDFDYLDWPAIEDGRDSASFFRYRGRVYDLGEFMRGGAEGWDGGMADSLFSGMPAKGKILAEHAVTVEHRDGRVNVSWDAGDQDSWSTSRGAGETAPLGRLQYSTVQDGWTTEVSAIRQAATYLLSTEGCWAEVIRPIPLSQDEPEPPAGHYIMRIRAKG